MRDSVSDSGLSGRSLAVVELPEQVEDLLAELGSSDTIVSCHPSASQALNQAGVVYRDIRSFYRHETLWSFYAESVRGLMQAAERIDSIAAECWPFLRETGLRASDFVAYQLKIARDQAWYRLFLSRSILDAVGPVDTVHCLTPGPISILPDLAPGNDFSVQGWALRELAEEYGYTLKVTPVPDRFRDEEENGLSRIQLWRVRRRVGRISDAVIHRLSTLRTRPKDLRVLSVGCRELDAIGRALENEGIDVVSVPEVKLTNRRRPTHTSSEAASLIAADPVFRESMRFSGSDGYEVVAPVVRGALEQFEALEGLRRTCRRKLEETRPDAVFVLSMASFHPTSLVYGRLCEEMGIPIACWMHGGYGGYNSLPGYDISDFRLCRKHIVYGKAVADLIASPDCVLTTLGIDGHESYVCGTPFFEKLYGNTKPKPDRIRRIVLAIGNLWPYNRFYFGYNRPYSEFSCWDEHRAIIELLVRYQDRYECVIKDYPSREVHARDTWDSLLAELGGDRIRVVTDEIPFEDLLAWSDAVVFTWMSTTFIQSLLTENDVFLVDDSDVTQEMEPVLHECVGFSRSVAGLLSVLEPYLATGVRARKEKGPLLEILADGGNRNRRAVTVAEAIREIVGENGSRAA